MYKGILVGCLLILAQGANSAIVWNWSFENPNIVVGTDEIVYLQLSITNEASSDASLYLSGFVLNDGSWGENLLIFNDDNEVIYTPSIYSNYSFTEVAPGESLSFIAGQLSPSNLVGGEIVKIKPLFWVRTSANLGEGSLLSQSASNMLQINVVAVPVPAAIWLYLSSLLMLQNITRPITNALTALDS